MKVLTRSKEGHKVARKVEKKMWTHMEFATLAVAEKTGSRYDLAT